MRGDFEMGNFEMDVRDINQDDSNIGLPEHNPQLLRRQSSNFREYRNNISSLER